MYSIKQVLLQKAEPEFEQIIPFNGHDADEMLKLAACIEEHFPHSMAKAIVRAAKDHSLPSQGNALRRRIRCSSWYCI